MVVVCRLHYNVIINYVETKKRKLKKNKKGKTKIKLNDKITHFKENLNKNAQKSIIKL